MPKRRKYSAEFKREAVALANQPGVTKAQIGRELDINPNMITRWQREMTANGSKAFLGYCPYPCKICSKRGTDRSVL